ncbi:MAG TPA: efflux RND transporter periplasmic adaptor subunit [Gemmatimonadaceae bacterium]|nr:efflux RND transporter periplasmic adaptor subunit [Gemmatimonadaceae bacterium]
MNRHSFAAVALLAALASATACKSKNADAAPVETATVERQDIVIDVEATGVIAPINAVDVRSKASGQITSMPVQTGQQVKPGQLLVKIDPRDAQQRYDQAAAAVRAARASVTVTKSQYDRALELSKQGVITAPELESATLAYANAQSQLTAAQTNLQIAQINLEDVTIRAPRAGTVIAKNVSEGQVISSATNSVSGGTALLSLADLSVVYDSTLVSEADIGKVKPGQQATVTVDAYPNRTFRGTVEKIEPRATVQQSVTMFPVSIRIENQDGALMPGMNTDVSILVQNAPNALAVPNDAVRSLRDASTTAQALGLDPQKVQEQLAAARGGGGGAGAAGSGAGNGGAASSGGAVGAANAATVAVTPAQCDSVTAALAKHPAQRDSLQQLQQQMRDGSLDFQAARDAMQKLYATAGVDARVARTCAFQRRNAAGGASVTGGASAGRASGVGGGAAGAGSGRGRANRGVVFVQQGTTFVPRMVTLGVGNYDVTQVVSGVTEGEKVALVASAVLQQNRTNQQQQIRSRTSLPGMGGGSTPAGGTTGGGRAGGAAGGAVGGRPGGR